MAAFKLYDIKDEGKLDISTLMQLLNSLDRNTYFAQEILFLVKEYKMKNIRLVNGFTG